MAFGRRRSTSLPDDLVREILLKLRSTKSAVRLSCVCKSWRDLITKDPDFREKLSNNIIKSGRNMKNDDPLMVFYTRRDNGRYHMRTHKHDKQVNIPNDLCLEPVGSCNGLVCFKHLNSYPEFHVYLYNPITCEYRRIPRPASSIGIKLPSYGFGFDSCSNDYKVISILGDNKAEVYKLSKNRWSSVVGGLNNLGPEYPIDPIQVSSKFVYANGCCFWRLREEPSENILSFDFRTEKFGLINLPEQARGSVDCLGLVDGSVAACFARSTRRNWHMNRMEIWVMSEYGNNLEWTKKFTANVFYLGPRFNVYFARLTNISKLLLVRGYHHRHFAGFKPSLVSLRTGSFLPPSK